MNRQERILYHQIHPLKLFTDIGVTFPTLVLFWRRDLMRALIIGFVPPIIVSAILVSAPGVDLEPYKRSRFGRYLKRYMTGTMQAVRLAGFGIAAVGAWLHWVWLIPAGLLVTLFGWIRGLLFPKVGAA